MHANRWFKRGLILLLLAFVSASWAQLGWHRYRLYVTNDAEAQRLIDSSLQLFSHDVEIGEVDVVVAPGMLLELWRLGIRYSYVGRLRDADSWKDEGLDRAFDYQNSYGRYDPIIQQYEDWRAQYPQFVSRTQIGTSINGRAIWAYRIWNPWGFQVNDPPAKTIFFQGVQHAREWVATSVPMFITDMTLRRMGTTATFGRLMHKFQLVVIPVANPDGYEYSWTNDRYWRKNRRNNGSGSFGVDLNRNWATGWGGEGSSGNRDSEVYRGTAAFSEPETRAIRDYANAIHATNPIVGFIDFHSYGQYILWPWGYTSALPPTQTELNNVASAMRTAMVNGGGRSYTIGHTYRTLYPASGIAPDWFYSTFGNIPCYTVELRDTGAFGFELPPSQILPTCQENWSGVQEFYNQLNALN